MRRYLSWIEGLTTNQYVGGSNPSRRTTRASAAFGRFFIFQNRGFEKRGLTDAEMLGIMTKLL